MTWMQSGCNESKRGKHEQPSRKQFVSLTRCLDGAQGRNRTTDTVIFSHRCRSGFFYALRKRRVPGNRQAWRGGLSITPGAFGNWIACFLASHYVQRERMRVPQRSCLLAADDERAGCDMAIAAFID